MNRSPIGTGLGTPRTKADPVFGVGGRGGWGSQRPRKEGRS